MTADLNPCPRCGGPATDNYDTASFREDDGGRSNRTARRRSWRSPRVGLGLDHPRHYSAREIARLFGLPERMLYIDPRHEPAWWRWPLIVELRLIAGDIARAGRWLRRLPWRAANSVYRRVPSWCPACHECGVRRETKMPLRFWSRLRHQGIFPLCNECRARLVRQQAEEFNAHLAKLLEDYERMLVSRDQP